jgi:chemotaxis protein CheD
MMNEFNPQREMLFQPAQKSIDLKTEKNVYPEGRRIMDEKGNETITDEPRKAIDISKVSGVADVEFLHYGSGEFDPESLKYIKTEPLGACVALTLWHPKEKIGIVAHFVITNNATDGMSQIFDKIKSAGLKPSDFEARLFGGGKGQSGDNKPGSQRLIRDAWKELSSENVPLLETDLYGDKIRCIALDLDEGQVYDYPYETESILKNDSPVENIKIPIRPMPKLSKR